MKLVRRLASLSPCALSLAFAPVFVMSLPDGVPYVYAECGAAGSFLVVSKSINVCSTCQSPGSGGVATLGGCTVTNPSQKCEINVSATLTINVYLCSVEWVNWCSGDACDTAQAGVGYFFYTISRTGSCTEDEDTIIIELRRDAATCDNCTPTVFLQAQGDC
jgi:hypothetical protein